MPPTGSTPEGEYNQEVQPPMLYGITNNCNHIAEELNTLDFAASQLEKISKTTPTRGYEGAWLNRLYNAVMRYNYLFAFGETRMRRNGYSVTFDILFDNNQTDANGAPLPARRVLTVSIPDIRSQGWIERVDAQDLRYEDDKGYSLVSKYHGSYWGLEPWESNEVLEMHNLR